MRTEGYQALRCPTCGEGIFVLPRSPLPEPSAPASPPRSRVAAAVEAFPDDDPLPLSDPSPMTTSTVDVGAVGGEPEVEIDWVDEGPAETGVEVKAPEAAPAPAGEVRPRPKASPKPVPARPQPPKPRAEPVPAVAVADRATLSEWAWGHRNALLAVGVLLLVIGAVAFRFRRQRLEDLPRIAEIGRTEGLRKLDSGRAEDFAAAKKLLADAASAVDGLGGRYEGAESIRQGAREAAIFTDLIPLTLAELVDEAARHETNEWPSYFAGKYRGQSIILDAPIGAVPDPAKPGSGYQIEYHIYYGVGPRPSGKARIELSGFQLFELSRPKVGDQQPFGARLASLELDLATNQWSLTLEPDSGVYITHPRALEAIGWPSFEPAEEPRP